MANKRVYVDHLRKVVLFEQLTRKHLEEVASSGVHLSLRDGTRLVEQGMSGNDAYVILSGTVQLRKKGRLVVTLGPGAIIGELSLLDDGPRTATATCVGDCEVLVLSRRAFRAVLDDVPALTHKLLASLAHRVRELDNLAYG